MDVIFVQEAKYIEYKGNLYSKRIDYATYWDRFLESFEKVTILARVKTAAKLPSGFFRSTGSNVNFMPIIDYDGPIEFIRKLKIISKQVDEALKKDVFIVLRVPSHLGVLVHKKLKRLNMPFSVEVVGDPYEVGIFLPIPFVFRKLYSYFMSNNMRRIAKDAIGALYVTKHHLQSLYPTKNHTINSDASNVFIPDSMYLSNLNIRYNTAKTIEKRLYNNQEIPVKIGVIGMLYPIKSSLEIVEAFHVLVKKGYNVKLEFAGDGPLLKVINSKSKRLNMDEKVYCHGSLSSGKEIFTFIDSLDLYIQFSKTEGLPRAMIEAMARSCPVISSNVGGISELIPQDLLVDRLSISELANKMIWLLNNKERFVKAINENSVKSKEYLESKLNQRKLNFYKKIKKELIKNTI